LVKKINQKNKLTASVVWRTGLCPVHQGGSTRTRHLRVSRKATPL
jgi:hypothetical protein